MTTHFSNGVTNVRGKANGNSLFSGIKQPLITGATTPAEFAYQDDFHTYNVNNYEAVVGTGNSEFIESSSYANGWLRMGDAASAADEDVGVQGYDNFQYSSTKQWYFETSIADSDATNHNWFVGFAQAGYADASALPTDCIGFSKLEDVTTITFNSRKDGAGVSFDMIETPGGSTFAMQNATYPTQTATVQTIPTNAVRLGFLYQPAGIEPGVTANQFKLYFNGNPVGTQAATTVPDDISLAPTMMLTFKGTENGEIDVDYFQAVQQR